MSTQIARIGQAKEPRAVDPLDMTQEIEIARDMIADSVRRYRDGCALWDRLTPEEQVRAQSFGLKAPSPGEVLNCLRTCGALQSAFGSIRAKDSVPVESLLEFMEKTRAIIAQHLPEEAQQKALLGAISELDLHT